MNIDIATLIAVLSAITGGGLIGAILTYRISSRKVNIQDFNTIIEVWQKDNTRLRDENQELKRSLSKLEDEVQDLRAKVILMESAHSDAPIPMWLKDTKGIMLSVNKAYEETFLLSKGLTASDYIGHDDYIVWDEALAEEYRKNDAYVLKTGKVWRGRETIEIDGELQQWRIIKYVRYAGKIKLGIAGIAIPETWQDS